MRGQTLPLSQVLTTYLRESGLEKPLLETRVVELWPEVMGSTIARLTRSIEMQNGLLIVHINSAALKAQLFDCRFQLVKKLNEAVGAEAIRDVRILG